MSNELYDSDINTFIIKQFFNIYNLINIYNRDYIYDYPTQIFDSNKFESERLYLDFSLNHAGVDFLEILPDCAEYAKKFNMLEEFTTKMIEEDWGYFFTLYAISLGRNIIYCFREKFDKILQHYQYKIFEIAINKLKRNKIVNKGFLLKISMKRSGMF